MRGGGASAIGGRRVADAATWAGLVARAGDPKRERWLQQVRRTGACRHPIRLRGVVRRGDHARLPRPLVTKSRHYSTTLGALRDARAAYRAEQDEPAEPDEDSTLVVAAWEYVGSGYLNPGDALLPVGVEASIRAGREAFLDARRL
jgi:hypothetical protein